MTWFIFWMAAGSLLGILFVGGYINSRPVRYLACVGIGMVFAFMVTYNISTHL